ncbi:MAG: RidA family protein [Bacteroidetes bacterium]|nr:MAG: RidA family protein [Bacteroidota bacterium]
MKKIINSADAPAPIGPYSQAVQTGSMLFVSGQVCFDPKTGDLVNQDIVLETHQVMKNIGAILKAAGMNYSNIVKTSIFVKDLNNFSTINTTYATYFSENPPARETVEVARLPRDVNVEISCIAVG